MTNVRCPKQNGSCSRLFKLISGLLEDAFNKVVHAERDHVKAMRGRTARLQRFAQNRTVIFLFREALGVRARPRAAFVLGEFHGFGAPAAGRDRCE